MVHVNGIPIRVGDYFVLRDGVHHHIVAVTQDRVQFSSGNTWGQLTVVYVCSRGYGTFHRMYPDKVRVPEGM